MGPIVLSSSDAGGGVRGKAEEPIGHRRPSPGVSRYTTSCISVNAADYTFPRILPQSSHLPMSTTAAGGGGGAPSGNFNAKVIHRAQDNNYGTSVFLLCAGRSCGPSIVHKVYVVRIDECKRVVIM